MIDRREQRLRLATAVVTSTNLQGAMPRTALYAACVVCVASLAPLRLLTTLPRTPTTRVAALHATRIDAPATDIPRRLAFRAAAAAAALAARPSSAQAVTTILADADAIDQPPTDQRRYRLVALSNGLRALLVSDETAETAAAALDVHVGYA